MKKLQVLLTVFLFGLSSVALAGAQQHTLTIHIINKTGKTLVTAPAPEFFHDTIVVKKVSPHIASGETSDLVLRRVGDYFLGYWRIGTFDGSGSMIPLYLRWDTNTGVTELDLIQRAKFHGELSNSVWFGNEDSTAVLTITEY